MGPQPNSCGNPCARQRRSYPTSASMGPQPNSCGNHLDPASARPNEVRFNGATAKQLWKRSDAAPYIIKPTASMGPQPNSCGNARAGSWPRSRSRCFNGATAKQLWKHPKTAEVARETAWLQWGHSQTAVETRDPNTYSLLDTGVASMGPQPNSCGNQERHAKAARQRVTLQWGHSQTAVETTASPPDVRGGSGLQWGHSQTAVETQPLRRYQRAFRRASMGPQPNSCGNARSSRLQAHSPTVLCFNGPQPNSCGNLLASFPHATPTLRLQWGHSQTAVETPG